MQRLALFVFLTLAVISKAQEVPQTFKFEVKVAKITGTDTYTITKSADGYRVAGTTEMNTQQGAVKITHSEQLGAAWDFNRYSFSAIVNGDTQKIEAVRKGDTVSMSAEIRGQVIPREVPWKPNTVVLDNFIGAHCQVLLNAIAAAKPGTTEWPLIVPQRLTAAIAKLDPKVVDGRGRWMESRFPSRHTPWS